MKVYTNIQDAQALEMNAKKEIEAANQPQGTNVENAKKESGPVSIPKAEKKETKAAKKSKRRKN